MSSRILFAALAAVTSYTLFLQLQINDLRHASASTNILATSSAFSDGGPFISPEPQFQDSTVASVSDPSDRESVSTKLARTTEATIVVANDYIDPEGVSVKYDSDAKARSIGAFLSPEGLGVSEADAATPRNIGENLDPEATDLYQ